MHKILTTLLLTLTLVTSYGAANGIDGEVLVKAGTTGNKALPTSQTTNVTISATSRVTDGASAVAFSLNSSNALSTGGAQSFQLQNAGTNIASILPSGAMRVGLAAAAGFDNVAGILFEGTSRADQASATLRNDTTDGNSFARWQLTNGGADTTNQLSFNQIDVGNNDQYTYIQEQVGVGDEQVNTKFVIGGDNDYVVFKPFVSSSTTPHTFDTSLTHTSGNLMAVKNNGTNYFTLQPDQSSTNTPITININGTLKRVHVGGPDSGGTGLRALAVEN